MTPATKAKAKAIATHIVEFRFHHVPSDKAFLLAAMLNKLFVPHRHLIESSPYDRPQYPSDSFSPDDPRPRSFVFTVPNEHFSQRVIGWCKEHGVEVKEAE